MYPKTYSEDGVFYGVVYLPNGHTYYVGHFNCRSTARRHAIKETHKHQFARQNGTIYNIRYGG